MNFIPEKVKTLLGTANPIKKIVLAMLILFGKNGRQTATIFRYMLNG